MNIKKFPLNIADVQTLEVPDGSLLLSVQAQGDSEIFAWIMTSSDKKPFKLRFYMVGAGNVPPWALDRWHYLASLQMRGGAVTMHVFTDKADGHSL